jgi:hypothetical protein
MGCASEVGHRLAAPLFDAGYAGLHWPKEYGGRGASPTEQLIFYEETARARAPYVGVNFVGTLHAGPTLIEEGSDEQKGCAPSQRSCAATKCGARASRNRAPDLIWLRCVPGRSATATITS